MSEKISTPFHDQNNNIHIDIIQLNSRIENRDLVGEKVKISGWGSTVPSADPGSRNNGLHLKYTMIPVIGIFEWLDEEYPEYREYGVAGSLLALSDNRTLNLTRGAMGGDSGGKSWFIILL